MELRAEGLSFSLEFRSPDVEGWAWCHAVVDVPGFHGDLDFQMLRSDLEVFRDQLSKSIDIATWPIEARLESTEPGIALSFRVERTGRIAGDYRFGGDAPHESRLIGKFAMDQTYLNPLLAQVVRVLNDFGR